MAEEAIPISDGLLPALTDLQSEAENTLSAAEDSQVADLANHSGWLLLRKRIDAEIAGLREMADMIKQTDTPSVIGFKFLASRLAIDKLQWVVDTVEATRVHVEQRKHETETEKVRPGSGS